MKETTTGKVSNYDIAQATGLWATDVSTIAQRVGADEYALIVDSVDVDGKIKRSVECYTLADALKIADYVKANPHVKAGGLHDRIASDFDKAFSIVTKAL